MLSTRIELNSKEACAVCGEHKLYTNDSEKNDSVVRWHCLNCNHTFAENESQKNFRQKKEKEDKQEKNSSSIGITIIALMMIAILTLVLDQQQKDAQDTSQPANQVEQLN